MDGRIDRQMGGWMDGWTGGQTDSKGRSSRGSDVSPEVWIRQESERSKGSDSRGFEHERLLIQGVCMETGQEGR